LLNTFVKNSPPFFVYLSFNIFIVRLKKNLKKKNVCQVINEEKILILVGFIFVIIGLSYFVPLPI